MRKLYIVMWLMSISFATSAQSVSIRGIILDGHDRPIAGATIRLAKNNKITTTNDEGLFRFTNLGVKQDTLMFSHVSFAPQLLALSLDTLQQALHIQLSPSLQQLDEVVVNDSYLERIRQEESLNVELVNDSFIRRNLGGSLMHSLEKMPGVSLIGIGAGQSKPLIRGLGFNRVVVIDKGIKHQGQQWGADHGLEIDQFALHQAEIIKGAASYMYGSDAIGGAINIQPKPAPEKYSLGGTVDIIGKTNNQLYGTSVNLYGRNRYWFFDTRVSHQAYGDYQVPTDTVYVYDFAVDLHEQKLRNTAGKETNLHFTVGYAQDNWQSALYLSNNFSKTGFFANAHGLEPRRVDRALHDRSSRDILHPYQNARHFKMTNRSTFYQGDHMLELDLGYQRNFRQEYNHYVNHGYMPAIYPEQMAIPSDLEREFEKDIYTLNFKDYITIAKHSLLWGINAEHQKNIINGWSFLIPSFNQTSWGAFVYDKYQWKPNLLFHTALRYDYGQIELFSYQDWFTSEVEEEGELIAQKVSRARDLSREFNSMVWSVGLNYRQTKLNFKANLGKSFRLPIAKELGANGVNYHYFSYERGNADLDPEQSYQADIGLSWQEKKWSVSVSPFFNYFSNYIYLNPTAEHDYLYGAGNQVFEYTQSRVVRYGAEVEVDWTIYRNISLEVLGEYLYAQQLSGDKKGYTLPFSPPPSVVLGLNWSPDTGEAAQHTYFSLDYRYTLRQDNIVPPEKKTPAYQLLNIQAGTEILFQNEPIALNLQIQNLLNTKYMKHNSFYRLIELPEPGRNFILSIKIPFTIINN